ncbi:MAG: 4Fe-4S dicluster domain-containing protein [Desulfarculaceae bacterium]|nr:4Fe-4S dicluster domain-containing protein [Desulfarculaceae bacterium]MCF8072536.1 4Fe-4S dicluster domain-containing protein [Desulfarculaceae bacterium]MCF8103439.1 4Fe-4S dicluster domain-containing protein [Desulfarculaceae bacterium]MCF8117077.1 4Fe-4S dicluster domain-containing protein [Desulfarculaceae bacterium]
MSKYFLLQDSERCIGCLACEIHCKSNKNLPVGPTLCKNMSVGPVAVEDVPRVRFVFMPCFHCEEPWCLNVCPSGAIQRRAKDGIVFIEPSLCIGCKSCITACPWGACQWDPATAKAVKCDYCMDRLDQGLNPACVTKCLTQCLEFGSADKLPTGQRERFAAQVARDHFNPKV